MKIKNNLPLSKWVLLLLVLIVCTGCAGSGSVLSYTDLRMPGYGPELVLLKPGETPRIIRYSGVADMTAKEQELVSNGYVKMGMFIGHPNYNESKAKKAVLEEATSVGATAILTDSDLYISDFYALEKKVP